mmetsp:Transcript_63397/g.136372  ORF Transcript_63397/g.136372 Transcript_63397/m.136372 type:complete len:245 (+) Transcript_63397:142-876(+)
MHPPSCPFELRSAYELLDLGPHDLLHHWRNVQSVHPQGTSQEILLDEHGVNIAVFDEHIREGFSTASGPAIHAEGQMELDPIATTMVRGVHRCAAEGTALLQVKEKPDLFEDSADGQVVPPLGTGGSHARRVRLAPPEAAIFQAHGVDASQPHGLDEAVLVGRVEQQLAPFAWLWWPCRAVIAIAKGGGDVFPDSGVEEGHRGLADRVERGEVELRACHLERPNRGEDAPTNEEPDRHHGEEPA